MPNALETMYGKLIKFSYRCFDRIVIRGHVPVLQGGDGGGVVSWARSLDPNIILDKSWFESWTAKFHINVKKFAEEHHLSILTPTHDEDKNELAKEHLPEDPNFVGVYVIMKAREMAHAFASQKSIHNTNPQHRNITREERYVDHFYFYLVDPSWGPICIRFCSHLPFNVKVFLNGNRWLFRKASARGLQVKANDNAITHCNDPAQLQRVSDSLEEKTIRSVCDTWVYRLLPVLTYEERHRSQFRYEWFFHQIEYSHNMMFKKAWDLTQLFHRHIGVNYEHFHPHQIQRFFGHRHGGRFEKTCDLRVHHQTESITVLRIRSRGCSLRQYNKLQQIFRSELTTNNVKDLGICKSLSNLNDLRKRMEEILDRFQQAQSSVHQAACSRGELAALAKPGQVDRSATPGIKLDNERTIRIVSLLPRLAQHSEGFRTRDLKDLLSDVTHKPLTTPQVSYTLRKLRAKKLIDRLPGQTRYRITPTGIRFAAVLPFLADRLCDAVIWMAQHPVKTKLPKKLITPLDQHYYQIEKQMTSITREMRLKAA
jgi:hypothetical protein